MISGCVLSEDKPFTRFTRTGANGNRVNDESRDANTNDWTASDRPGSRLDWIRYHRPIMPAVGGLPDALAAWRFSLACSPDHPTINAARSWPRRQPSEQHFTRSWVFVHSLRQPLGRALPPGACCAAGRLWFAAWGRSPAAARTGVRCFETPSRQDAKRSNSRPNGKWASARCHNSRPPDGGTANSLVFHPDHRAGSDPAPDHPSTRYLNHWRLRDFASWRFTFRYSAQAAGDARPLTRRRMSPTAKAHGHA